MASLRLNVCQLSRQGLMGIGKLYQVEIKLLPTRIGDIRLYGNGKIFYVCNGLSNMYQWPTPDYVRNNLISEGCVIGCAISLVSGAEPIINSTL